VRRLGGIGRTGFRWPPERPISPSEGIGDAGDELVDERSQKSGDFSEMCFMASAQVPFRFWKRPGKSRGIPGRNLLPDDRFHEFRCFFLGFSIGVQNFSYGIGRHGFLPVIRNTVNRFVFPSRSSLSTLAAVFCVTPSNPALRKPCTAPCGRNRGGTPLGAVVKPSSIAIQIGDAEMPGKRRDGEQVLQERFDFGNVVEGHAADDEIITAAHRSGFPGIQNLRADIGQFLPGDLGIENIEHALRRVGARDRTDKRLQPESQKAGAAAEVQNVHLGVRATSLRIAAAMSSASFTLRGLSSQVAASPSKFLLRRSCIP